MSQREWKMLLSGLCGAVAIIIAVFGNDPRSAVAWFLLGISGGMSIANLDFSRREKGNRP